MAGDTLSSMHPPEGSGLSDSEKSKYKNSKFYNKYINIRTFILLFVIFIRLYLGAWMLLNGLNHFLPIFPQPMGGEKSSQLMVTLIETGLFGLVKGAEILVGVLLLLDIFVPVALVISMPISVIVWFNQAFLGRSFFAVHMSTGCLVYTVVLLIAYLPSFLPMMRLQTPVGQLSDFKRIGQIFVSPNRSTSPARVGRRLLVLLIGLAITVVLFWQLHPWTPQPAGAGKTPATIVSEYLSLAYGKGARAADIYLSPLAQRNDERLVFSKNGQALQRKVLSVVAQGPNVVVHQLIQSPAGGPDVDTVDFYHVEKGWITSHVRVAEPPTLNDR